MNTLEYKKDIKIPERIVVCAIPGKTNPFTRHLRMSWYTNIMIINIPLLFIKPKKLTKADHNIHSRSVLVDWSVMAMNKVSRCIKEVWVQ